MRSAAASTERLALAGAADALTAAKLRRDLQRWLQRVARPAPEIYDGISLGVYEALANCVEHAYRHHPGPGHMKLQAVYDPADESLHVYISDGGTWHRRGVMNPKDPHASRGILLMHALADRCTIQARAGGTTVCLHYSVGLSA